MVASCPQCQARFRLAPEKIGPQGARIRCSKCQHIFKVGPPEPAPSAPAEVPAAAPPKPAPPARPVTKGPKLLVAEPDSDAAKTLSQVLERWGLAAEVVNDGVEALLWIFRKKPPAVVLGGHLPGVSGPVISELVRRTAELKSVRLIRVAPLDEPVGAPELEADRTIEPGELAVGLEAALEALELGLRPQPEATPPAAPAAKAGAGAAAAAGRSQRTSDDPEIAAAERLARIIVSDIVLYNQEKFQAAAKSGNVAAALEPEISEASALFRQRIPEEVRAKRDFLLEELERRARG